MRVVIIYESLYGNTHTIADAIARGLWRGNDVSVVPVGQAHADLLEGADLVVVGGPTHAHSMSRASTRQAAAERAGRPDNLLTLDAGVTADGPGIREWLGALGQPGANGPCVAAFDTRRDAPAIVTGRASKGIARLLQRNGLTLMAPAESFLVTRENRLQAGEKHRAYTWGQKLAAEVAVGLMP
jgi:hypothetical protein